MCGTALRRGLELAFFIMVVFIAFAAQSRFDSPSFLLFFRIWFDANFPIHHVDESLVISNEAVIIRPQFTHFFIFHLLVSHPSLEWLHSSISSW
jgi:hypothetical protein